MNLYQHLAHEERYLIYRLLKNGYSIRQISHHIGRSPSSISRELKRNTGGRGYRYKHAHLKAIHRRNTSHRTVSITEERYVL